MKRIILQYETEHERILRKKEEKLIKINTMPITMFLHHRISMQTLSNFITIEFHAGSHQRTSQWGWNVLCESSTTTTTPLAVSLTGAKKSDVYRQKNWGDPAENKLRQKKNCSRVSLVCVLDE